MLLTNHMQHIIYTLRISLSCLSWQIWVTSPSRLQASTCSKVSWARYPRDANHKIGLCPLRVRRFLSFGWNVFNLLIGQMGIFSLNLAGSVRGGNCNASGFRCFWGCYYWKNSKSTWGDICVSFWLYQGLELPIEVRIRDWLALRPYSRRADHGGATVAL